MAAKQQKTTYTAAEVAVLESKIQEQQTQIVKRLRMSGRIPLVNVNEYLYH